MWAALGMRRLHRASYGPSMPLLAPGKCCDGLDHCNFHPTTTRLTLHCALSPVPQEGGGRKGLPKSFLNRFTRVGVELLSPADLTTIAATLHPALPAPLLHKMVATCAALHAGANVERAFGSAGGPWEFNLRDLLRWAELATGSVAAAAGSAGSSSTSSANGRSSDMQLDGATAESDAAWAAAVHRAALLLFLQRMRTHADRAHVAAIWARVWGAPLDAGDAGDGSSSSSHPPQLLVGPEAVAIGSALLPRAREPCPAAAGGSGSGSGAHSAELLLPRWQAPLLESAARCVQRGWMCLLVGGAGAGKTSLTRLLAQLAGEPLLEVPLTSGTDTSDLLGSFEQVCGCGCVLVCVCSHTCVLCRCMLGGAAKGEGAAPFPPTPFLYTYLTYTCTPSNAHAPRHAQVEPARKVEDLATRLKALLAAASQALLLGAASSPTPQAQQHTRRLALARSLSEAWEAYAAAGAADAANTAGSGGGGPVAVALHRLERLDALVARLQVLPPDMLQSLPQEGQQLEQPLLARLAALAADAAALRGSLSSPSGASTAGRFEWVDGCLTRAIEAGGWVLLDNANLCNPTVLDRLNPLLEPGGVLALNEAGGSGEDGGGGAGRVLQPHPGFRLFLALDPRHGEVSRAMRNRGIELFFLPPLQQEAPQPAATAAQLQAAPGSGPGAEAALAPLSWAASGDEELEQLLASCGVAGGVLLAAMAVAHAGVVAAAAAAHRKPPGMREAREWAGAAAALLERGASLAHALWGGWAHAYVHSQAPGSALEGQAKAAFCQLCTSLGLQPPRAARPPAASGAQAMELSDSESESECGEPDAAPEDGEPASSGAAAAGVGDGVGSYPWPHGLVRPARWPASIRYAALAASSRLEGAARDAALLEALLAEAAAADASAAPQVSLASACLQRLAPQQLALLPARVLAAHLQGQDASDLGSLWQQRALVQLLPHLALVAAGCFAERARAADWQLRLRWPEVQLQQLGAYAQALQLPHGGGAAGVGQLCVQLLRSLLQGQGTQQLLQALAALAATSLDHGGSGDERSALAWQLLALHKAAATYAAIEAAAREGADLAALRGAATPYQLSAWRHARPQERARRAPEHPALDGVYPCLTALAELEAALLRELVSAALAPAAAATQRSQVSAAATSLGALQDARAELWDALHGPLHAHVAACAAAGQLTAAPSGEEAAERCSVLFASAPHQVDGERLAWAWRQVDKRAARLLALAPEQAASEAGQRWVGVVVGRLAEKAVLLWG